MKGWKLINGSVQEQEIIEDASVSSDAKVKITKALISLRDITCLTGETETENVVLGGCGIGIISEATNNLFGLEKSQRVYIDPYRACNNCYNCKNNEQSKCSDIQLAGQDFDGFLSDFAVSSADRLYALPDSVSDLEALFIGHISLAISIVDKLGVQKGDYVAIVGANNFGNILAQLLIYYQAVPIILGFDEENLKIAKSSGIYYVLGPEDNWQKEVSNITGGHLAQNVVYVTDCNIPTSKAFSVASFNANVVFTGDLFKSNYVSFAQAVKKQLNIFCINIGINNNEASINLIANNAVDISKLKLDSASYVDVPDKLDKMTKTFESKGKIYETVIDLL